MLDGVDQVADGSANLNTLPKRTKIPLTPWLANLMFSGASLAVSTKSDGQPHYPRFEHLRGMWQEPFDVFAHVSNLAAGSFTATILGMMASSEPTTSAEGLSEAQAKRPNKGLMAFVGFVGGIVTNAVLETRIGVNLMQEVGLPASTADSTDFAYGVIASTIIATVSTDKPC